MRTTFTRLTMTVALALLPISIATTILAAPMQGTTVYSIEDTPVWRVQLAIKTADVSTSGYGSGGTKHLVNAKLNTNNLTRLYTSFGNADMFSPGETYTYELILDNVKKLRDITSLELSKPGADYWCVESLSLIVNGRVVFAIDFAGAGTWVGPGGFLHIPGFQLRTHTLWRSYTLPSLPQMISGAELIHRIDSLVGDFIIGDTLRIDAFPPIFHYWRPAGDFRHSVTVTGNGPRTVHVDLDLQYRTFYQYNVDVEFDLEFACASGKLFIMTRNLDMRGYQVVDNNTLTTKSLLTMFLQTVMPAKFQAAFQTVTYTNELGQPGCPAVRVVGNSVYLF